MANEKLIAFSEVKKKLTAIRQYFSGPPSTDQDKLARSVVKLCMEEVGKIKPVDAVEVVHGRWEHLGGDEWCCTACGEVTHTEGSWEKPYQKYCYECGAKMDGERRTDNG